MNARISIASFEGEVEVTYAMSAGSPAYVRYGRTGFSEGLPEDEPDLDVDAVEFIRADQPARTITARFVRLPREWRAQIVRAVFRLMDEGRI